jgi:LuxR family maltose regulon positive regulatory protein
MAKMTPLVRGDTLVYQQNDCEQVLVVGTPTWYDWLTTASTFAFSSDVGSFTARKERASNQRGGWYWKAYRTHRGKLSSLYLGKSEALTPARLQTVAQALVVSSVPVSASGPDQAVVSAETARNVSPQGSPAPFTPLLSTKLHAPRPRAQVVPRPQLSGRLQQGAAGALTLLSAPAGFGKTTLLAQWLAQSGRPAAWLSLEPEDNEPMRFLSYLIAALQTLDPHIGTTALSLLHTPHPTLPETILALLINELEQREGGAFILVLDDYHVITAEPLHRALTFLLEHLPPQMHLILATRADPPLPLARLRARGQLTELRALELRFKDAEASVFLEEVMGLHLTPSDVATLQTRTEGWIVGLQLAALSLRGRADVSAFLATFTGSHRFVLDYLSDEVLARQSAEVQAFLLRTSILERLSGPLCQAVTEQGDSQAMLEALEKANLFVVSLDEERGWYRYHHLFAEVLHNRLRQAEPTLVAELHGRASAWYERQGLAVEAVQHAFRASDVERAASLVERIGMAVGYRGQVYTVLGWLNALPDALVRTRPALCISHALTLIFIGQMEQAEARLRDAEGCIHADMQPLQARAIRGQVSVIRGNIARYCGDLARSVTLSRQALELLPETEMMHAGALVYAAQAYLVSGDVTSAAEHQAASAVQSARAWNHPFLSLRSIITLARLQVLQGRLRQAATTYAEAVRVTSNQEVLRVLTSGPAYSFGLADVLREWNDLDEASRVLAQGMEVLESGTLLVDADVVLLGYTTLARLHHARGAYSEALSTIDAFMNLTRQRQVLPLLVAQMAAVRTHIELARTDPAGHETLGTDAVLQDALSLLSRLLEDAQAKARMDSVLEILLLRALAFATQGDGAQALASLERALRLAEPEGYLRLFVDEGEPIVALLRQAYAQGIVPEYVATLLAAAGSLAPAAPPPPGSLLEPLTERELEVLRLLVRGLSNAAMARELIITVGTVKSHVSHIYGKLGVQSRSQAIARAHILHLL